MKTLFLILALTFIFDITVTAKPHPKKQRHQNLIFQNHLQSVKSNSFEMNQSFKPKGQYIFFKLF